VGRDIRHVGLTLDTGALIAVERADSRTLDRLNRANRNGRPVTVPTPCLVEAWRGGARAARLARLLALVDVEPLGETLARRAGVLLSLSGTRDATDAVVVASAALRGDAILTSDPDDIGRLAEKLPAVAVLTV
jgi:predicted nucleic acid-binding protein